MEADGRTELGVCQALAHEIEAAELFVYPGSGHLFADSSSPDHEPGCARLMLDRALVFLQSMEIPAADFL
jgi:hypothetical protein